MTLRTFIKAFFIYINMVLITSCASIREFPKMHSLSENSAYEMSQFEYDSSKKTVVIIADHQVTELFDLIAPFYLLAATEEANTYIISKEKKPVYLFKGLFVMPHITFQEFYEAGLTADAIIVPNLSGMKPNEQDPVILDWINHQYTENAAVLSICAGASTVASTGIYDQQPLTTHSSDLEQIKSTYAQPNWIRNVSVTKSNNLYSTAGVSNATEGSLVLIQELFGDSTRRHVMNQINYPYPEINMIHKTSPIDFSHKMRILRKSLFGKNLDINFLLEDGINAFQLAAALDTYNRTFPRSISTFSLTNEAVTSKYGLVLIPTSNREALISGEVHAQNPQFAINSLPSPLSDSKMVIYGKSKYYIFDECLIRIEEQHGKSFQEVVKRMLDYM